MAADAQDSPASSLTPFEIGVPDEIIANILIHATTPTFIQLTRTSRQFQSVARSSRQVLLHHLKQLPGDKTIVEEGPFENEKLFLLVRQRAANHLYGANFTANLHEHLVKNAKLEPAACSISGLDADYVRMALVFKDSVDIRQYTNHGKIKEKIETCLGPRATILKLVQWARWVSVLCRVSTKDDLEVSDDDRSPLNSDSDDSDTEPLEPKILKPTANSILTKFYLSLQDVKVGRDRKKSQRSRDVEYRIVHFDVYTIEDSQIFIVDPYQNYVPRDFAVHSTTNCAILWDRDTPKGRPTENAAVVTYTSDKPQVPFPVHYVEKVVWPKAGKPERPNTDSDDDDTPEYLPERISFFKEGRRIKLYDSGSVVPYEILSSTTTQHDQYASTNVLRFDGFSFHVDTPFFGTHATYWDDLSQHSFCFVTHLCLGTSTIDIGDDDNENEVRVLCILRSQSRLYPENCDHRISLQRMTHVSAGSSTVVARLWGFEELQTTLTGKETVAISQGGTRIAIAMWDKVYIYPINPKVLCEDVIVDSSDDEVKIKKKKKKAKKPWNTTTNAYYPRKKDRNLLDWKVAEIRPIVLDLNGAVAHKMNWSPAKGPITDTYVPEPVIVIKDDAAEENAIEIAEVTPGEQETTATQPNNDVATVESSSNNESNTTASISATEEAPTVQNANDEAAVVTGISEPTVVEQTVCQSDEAKEEVALDASIVLVPADKAGETISGLDVPIAQSPQTVAENATTTSIPALDNVAGPASPVAKIVSPTIPPTSADGVSLVNGTSPHLPDILPTLNQSLPLHPLSSNAATQSQKPSLKRKDKSSDINNSEIVVTHILEKEKSTPAQVHPDSKSNSDVSAPPSPTLSKTIPKPKQTVSEALSTSPSVPQLLPQLSCESQTPAITEPSSQSVEAKPQSGEKQPSEDNMLMASSSQGQSSTEAPPIMPEEIAQPEAQVETAVDKMADATSSDLSKTAITNVAESSVVNEQTSKDDEAEKAVKRKKRITEDELIILTDRGVQVWNVGARAKGKRKKSVLPFEESLKGKLPNRHGKSRATVEEHTSDAD